MDHYLSYKEWKFSMGGHESQVPVPSLCYKFFFFFFHRCNEKHPQKIWMEMRHGDFFNSLEILVFLKGATSKASKVCFFFKNHIMAINSGVDETFPIMLRLEILNEYTLFLFALLPKPFLIDKIHLYHFTCYISLKLT